MHGGSVPILFVNSAFIPVQVQLIHAEHDREIFGLPLFFVRILVSHPHVPHNTAAAGIVSVVCRSNIRQAVLFHPLYNRFARLCGDAPVPELLTEPVAEIMGFLHIDLDIADGKLSSFRQMA